MVLTQQEQASMSRGEEMGEQKYCVGARIEEREQDERYHIIGRHYRSKKRSGTREISSDLQG